MEAAGLVVGVVGLAGLYSVCLEAVRGVDAYRDLNVDSATIVALFDSDKYLFEKWSRNVGIQSEKDGQEYGNKLDDPETYLVVQNVLQSIRQLFDKTAEKAQSLRPALQPTATRTLDQKDPLLRNRRDVVTQITGPSKRDKLAWSLGGKARFFYQVEQFGSLVQRLYSLVPTAEEAKQYQLHKSMSCLPLSADLRYRKANLCRSFRLAICKGTAVQARKTD